MKLLGIVLNKRTVRCCKSEREKDPFNIEKKTGKSGEGIKKKIKDLKKSEKCKL